MSVTGEEGTIVNWGGVQIKDRRREREIKEAIWFSSPFLPTEKLR